MIEETRFSLLFITACLPMQPDRMEKIYIMLLSVAFRCTRDSFFQVQYICMQERERERCKEVWWSVKR